jgi:hypothetical protein
MNNIFIRFSILNSKSHIYEVNMNLNLVLISSYNLRLYKEIKKSESKWWNKRKMAAALFPLCPHYLFSFIHDWSLWPLSSYINIEIESCTILYSALSLYGVGLERDPITQLVEGNSPKKDRNFPFIFIFYKVCDNIASSSHRYAFNF